MWFVLRCETDTEVFFDVFLSIEALIDYLGPAENWREISPGEWTDGEKLAFEVDGDGLRRLVDSTPKRVTF